MGIVTLYATDIIGKKQQPLLDKTRNIQICNFHECIDDLNNNIYEKKYYFM